MKGKYPAGRPIGCVTGRATGKFPSHFPVSVSLTGEPGSRYLIMSVISHYTLLYLTHNGSLLPTPTIRNTMVGHWGARNLGGGPLRFRPITIGRASKFLAFLACSEIYHSLKYILRKPLSPPFRGRGSRGPTFAHAGGQPARVSSHYPAIFFAPEITSNAYASVVAMWP